MVVKKVILSTIILSILMGLIFANVFMWQKSSNFPQVSGVFLAQSKPLPDFQLLDQNNDVFANTDLQGHWSIVTYGFTSCPDVCPMIMADLNNLNQMLDSGISGKAVNIIFYSIDPERDTADKLKTYLNYFNPKFIGLVSVQGESRNVDRLESSLGLNYKLFGAGESDLNYEVAHGLEIFVINPSGHLQAVLTPQRSSDGVTRHKVQLLYQDFIEIKNYYDRQKKS